MSEQEYEQQSLPLPGAGPRLRAAREAAGLSRSEIATRTRISERMIAQIEAGDFAGLPARTYAIGFTRTYARAVGLNEAEMIAEVRRELGMAENHDQRGAPALEPGDPARVPSARFAWILALVALILLAGSLWIWRSYTSPAIDLPSILPDEQPTIEPTFAPAAILPEPAASLDPLASQAPDPSATGAAPMAPRRPAAAPARQRPARVPLTMPPSPQPVTDVQPQAGQSPSTSTVTN